MSKLRKLAPILLSISMVAFLFTGCFNREENSMSTIPETSSEIRDDSSSIIMNEDDVNSYDSSQSGTSGSNDMQGDLDMDGSGSHSNSTSNSENSMDNSTSGSNSSSSSSGAVSSSESGTDSSQSYSEAAAKASVFTQEAIAVFASTQPNWNMTLVNAQNPLEEGFAIELVEVNGFDDRLFDARAVENLENLLDNAQKAGVQLYLVSAYRSPERQQTLYNNKVAFYTGQGNTITQAEELAAKWVAKPYTSEHNLGLAVDLVSADWYANNSDLTAEFENTPHFDWLIENCADYGFILRYPSGKESITGVNYEPWHFRYVGIEEAQKIMQSGLTLEEYVARTMLNTAGTI